MEKNDEKRRIKACLNACEGIKTDALERGFVKDILMQYYELCDIHELQNLITCCYGDLYQAVLKDVSELWDDLNAWDIEQGISGEENER